MSTEVFRKRYKKVSYKAFDEKAQERLKGRLPEEMLELLLADGFASYDEQLLWSVDPDDLGDVVRPWLPSAEQVVPLMRTSFGELFLWDGVSVFHASIHLHVVAPAALLPSFLFEDTLVDNRYRERVLRLKYHRRARKEVGELESDECYMWVPALALGGDPSSSSIGKGRLRETLVIQSQTGRIART